jgi:hypothetical protein
VECEPFCFLINEPDRFPAGLDHRLQYLVSIGFSGVDELALRLEADSQVEELGCGCALQLFEERVRESPWFHMQPESLTLPDD